MENLFAVNSFVWPLCFLLVALLVLKQVRDDVRPIFIGIIGGLTAKAQSNAVEWALLLLVATLGSMQQLIQTAQENHWLFVESFAKVATPFIGGIVAGMRISPLTSKTPAATVTPPEKEKIP